MDALKKFFPLSFGAKEIKDLVIKIIIYIVAAAIGGAVIAIATAILAIIPLIGGLLAAVVGILGGLVGLYALLGIVILCLDYFKVLK